jgi:pyruvate dehydrogenase E2 component (dihydrolipoamide acetyltransferase)
MPTNLLMPAVSPGMEKGDLVRWVKREGESFVSGEILAEVETDKAIVEIPAPSAGELLRILVPEGTREVKVDQAIAVLATEHEAIPVASTAGPPPPTHPQASSAAGTRLFASPLARRLAKEAAVPLAAVKGTGPGGRIVERDVAAHIAGRRDLGEPPGTERDNALAFEVGTYEATPHDGMRRALAARLTDAARTIPQFGLSVDCHLDELIALRERRWDGNGTAAAGGVRVSLSVYFLKAYSCALKKVPEANVVWTESALLRLKRIDIGVAVALPGGGLLTPVVRQVDSKTIRDLAVETDKLVDRARQRRLQPEQFHTAATAISNLGMFGIHQFNAIVTAPYSSMLAIGAARQSVLDNGERMLSCRVMTATLTCDHRVLDGALAARLLNGFKQAVETPSVWDDERRSSPIA